MRIAVLTFDAFNEIDSFVAASMLNHLAPMGWRAYITAPTARVTSKNGVVVEAQRPLEFTADADAVIVGSGKTTDAVARDAGLLARLTLDPARQLIASQCSGALILHALGLLGRQSACTDHMTRPLLVAAGAAVLDTSFHAEGTVATAGGCLASPYIAAWMIARRLGVADAERILRYVAPVGEEAAFVGRVLAAVTPFINQKAV